MQSPDVKKTQKYQTTPLTWHVLPNKACQSQNKNKSYIFTLQGYEVFEMIDCVF